MKQYAIAIHGGAGTILPSEMDHEKELAYTGALRDALLAGQAVLVAGGTAVDAVSAAVCSLEDCPLFNAGRGSVFNAAGFQEMDASIMDGATRAAGAIAAVTGIRNPVRLACAVMDHSGHVLLIGEGAMAFARLRDFEIIDDTWFYDEHRYKQWCAIRDTDGFQLDHTANESKYGTVGAVALDMHGHLAAATSTGGMTNKRFGRVGDSPIIGAGNYAWDKTCAVSCTGSGEYFLRGVVAYDVSCLMEYKGLSLAAACDTVIHSRLPDIGGDGGLIAIDRQGNIALTFNTPGMYRGCITPAGEEIVRIFK